MCIGYVFDMIKNALPSMLNFISQSPHPSYMPPIPKTRPFDHPSPLSPIHFSLFLDFDPDNAYYVWFLVSEIISSLPLSCVPVTSHDSSSSHTIQDIIEINAEWHKVISTLSDRVQIAPYFRFASSSDIVICTLFLSHALPIRIKMCSQRIEGNVVMFID